MKTFEGYQHGINLGGWLSQCDHTWERYQNFIKEEDIAKIRDWGLDHVRVPVDYNLIEDKEGNYKEEGFEFLQKVATDIIAQVDGVNRVVYDISPKPPATIEWE